IFRLSARGAPAVMCALDAYPAIFGITQDPFLVFTATVFALMGLRQLYFLLGGLLDKLPYLHYGIAAILAFIGVKLLLHALHETDWLPESFTSQVPVISTRMSLGFIVLARLVATIASLIAMKRAEEAPLRRE